TLVVDVNAPAVNPALLWDMSSDERYKDPGRPIYKVLPSGAYAMRQDGDSIFLSGAGATPDGDRPFLDHLDLKSRESKRLFRSDVKGLEYFLALVDDTKFLTWHQSPVDPPNAFMHVAGDAQPPRAITHIPDPTPQ